MLLELVEWWDKMGGWVGCVCSRAWRGTRVMLCIYVDDAIRMRLIRGKTKLMPGLRIAGTPSLNHLL